MEQKCYQRVLSQMSRIRTQIWAYNLKLNVTTCFQIRSWITYLTFLFLRSRACLFDWMIDIQIQLYLHSTINDISVPSMIFYHVRQHCLGKCVNA